MTIMPPPIDVKYLAGSASSGIIVANDTEVYRLENINSIVASDWKKCGDLTGNTDFHSPILGLAGEIGDGPVVFSSKEGVSSVVYNSNYRVNKWLSPLNLDPEISVRGITGTNTYGPIVWGGIDLRSIKRLQDYSSGNWIGVDSPPLYSIQSLAGDNLHGPIALGLISTQQQIFILENYQTMQWVQKRAVDTTKIPNALKIVGHNNTGYIIAGYAP
jgi:hypothetical protein